MPFSAQLASAKQQFHCAGSGSQAQEGGQGYKIQVCMHTLYINTDTNMQSVFALQISDGVSLMADPAQAKHCTTI